MLVQSIIGDESNEVLISKIFDDSGEDWTEDLVAHVGVNPRIPLRSAKGWRLRQVGKIPGLFAAVSPGLVSRKDPHSRSQKQGSGALYLFEGQQPYYHLKRAVLGQYLPSGVVTSCHQHSFTREVFVLVQGQVSCWTPQVCKKLEIGYPEIVPPSTPHYLTSERDSFVAIIMDGPYGLGMEDHHYVNRDVVDRSS